MISLKKLRDLDVALSLANPLEKTNTSTSFISAASGLVIVKKYLYVVTDDENYLGVFSLEHNGCGESITVFAGELPLEKSARKKLKPDLETLALLPASNDFPHGSLIALGSGSKENRQKGIILSLDANGKVNKPLLTIDLSSLYAIFRQHFADLNIEGSFIANDQIVFMQRGNQSNPKCALIYCDLKLFLQLQTSAYIDFSDAIRIVYYTLPCSNEVPLCFTDGTLLPNGNILFTAAAEDTRDSYSDGVNVGSAIGIIHTDGKLLCCELSSVPHKMEGIAIVIEDKKVKVLVVTDADNAAIAATLFEVENSEELIKHLF